MGILDRFKELGHEDAYKMATKELAYANQQLNVTRNQYDNLKDKAKDALKTGNAKKAQEYATSMAQFEKDITQMEEEANEYLAIQQHAFVQTRREQNGNKRDTRKLQAYAEHEMKEAEKLQTPDYAKLKQANDGLRRSIEARNEAVDGISQRGYVPQRVTGIMSELEAELSTEQQRAGQLEKKIEQVQGQTA
jgi:hypothetical protein